MNQNWKKLIIALALPLAVGGLATALSGGMGDYQDLVQPPLSPPGWVFPVVWTVLYLLMGYSSYRIYISGKPEAEIKSALRLYLAQLGLNFLWPIVFFGLAWYLPAFFLLLALWVVLFLTVRAFTKLDERAGDLLIPYLLWVTFAGYLNLGIAIGN